MAETLVEKVAVITGGSRGIGRAVAGELALRGADLMLIARTAGDLEKEAASIAAHTGRRVLTVATDLRRPDGVDAAVKAVHEGFGRTDILVNNAGATRGGDFLELEDAIWEDGFALKFYAAVRMSRGLWPDLARARGAVVNISGGFADVPDANFMISGAVNAALTNFSKALAERGIEGRRQRQLHPPGPGGDRPLAPIDRRAGRTGGHRRGRGGPQNPRRQRRSGHHRTGRRSPIGRVSGLCGSPPDPGCRHPHGRRAPTRRSRGSVGHRGLTRRPTAASPRGHPVQATADTSREGARPASISAVNRAHSGPVVHPASGGTAL